MKSVILLITMSETKLNDSFPTRQFSMNGFIFLSEKTERMKRVAYGCIYRKMYLAEY